MDAQKLDWKNEDRWHAQDLGLEPNTTQSMYYLNFSRLQQSWLKLAVKRFVRLQAGTKSYASCRSYIVGLAHFSMFLNTAFPENSPSTPYNRKLVIEYISFLASKALSPTSRQIALIHLRTFQMIASREGWLPWPKDPLVYSSDLPKPTENIPRFIPELILSQLKENLPCLSTRMRNFIVILLETGRRVSEICTLPFNCLEQDEENDWLLQVHEKKLKKSYLIPISPECMAAINSQQTYVMVNHDEPYPYLFPCRQYIKAPHITARSVNKALNELAKKCKIQNSDGYIWHFHAHQFRHTVGTRMINAGVPQVIIQRYLGHETPEMTARYAYIHDATLKAAFYDYKAQLVDISGNINVRNDQIQEATWLRKNIMAQALPNGICCLPSINQKCPHANACLTCAHFRTTKQFIPQHQAQLQQIDCMIAIAEKNGWARQIEMNLTVKSNLQKIINTLQESSDEQTT